MATPLRNSDSTNYRKTPKENWRHWTNVFLAMAKKRKELPQRSIRREPLVKGSHTLQVANRHLNNLSRGKNHSRVEATGHVRKKDTHLKIIETWMYISSSSEELRFLSFTKQDRNEWTINVKIR